MAVLVVVSCLILSVGLILAMGLVVEMGYGCGCRGLCCGCSCGCVGFGFGCVVASGAVLEVVVLAYFSGSLFDWSRAWGLTSSDSLPLFLCSLLCN